MKGYRLKLRLQAGGQRVLGQRKVWPRVLWGSWRLPGTRRREVRMGDGVLVHLQKIDE
jgi:hypothetical protein